jgi:hypothetical protein
MFAQDGGPTPTVTASPAAVPAAGRPVVDSPAVDLNWQALLLNLSDGEAQGQTPLGDLKVVEFLEIARQKGYNLFQVLVEAGPELRSRGIRLAISGESLRGLNRIYSLGDHRVYALLPIDKLIRIEVGASRNGGPEVEVHLDRTHSEYLELGTFAISTQYGFKIIGPRALEQAYGVKVRKGLLNFDLSKIEIVPSPLGNDNINFIAIHLSMFPRPKRWEISPVTLR